MWILGLKGLKKDYCVPNENLFSNTGVLWYSNKYKYST